MYNRAMERRSVAKLCVLAFLLVCALVLPKSVCVLANSAPSIKPDDGGGIVFAQHEFVGIRSEVLDIVVNDDLTASISATYVMKNYSLESLSVKTMFLTPVLYGNNKDISVQRNGVELNFNQEFYGDYSYNDNKAQDIEDWESVLESGRNSGLDYSENEYVAAIVYYVDFEPNEELELRVSYVYQMGAVGYRHTASILYYLTPAKYWKDFADIEINLTLGERYKKLKSSSLRFDRIDDKHYKFSSNVLPDTELKIVVSDGSFASFCGCATIDTDEFVVIGSILIALFAVLLYTKRGILFKQEK